MTKGRLLKFTRTLLALTLISCEVSLQVVTKLPIYATFSKNRMNSRQPQTKEPIAPITVTAIASETTPETSHEYLPVIEPLLPVLSGDGPQDGSHEKELLPPLGDAEETEIRDHALDSAREEETLITTRNTYDESSDLDAIASRSRWKKPTDVLLKGTTSSTLKYGFVNQTASVMTQKLLAQTTSSGTSATLPSRSTNFQLFTTAVAPTISSSTKPYGQGSESTVKTKQKSICDLSICNCTDLQVICRCQDSNTGIHIQQNMHWVPPDTEELQIANCGYIGLQNGCLNSLRQLRKAEFKNIKDIAIHRNGLNTAEVPRGLKRVTKIEFANVLLQPGSISGHLGDLTFINVTIKSIGTDSFKALVLDTLTVFGSEINTIEKGGFDNCTIKWLNITGSELQQIKPEAIDINGLTDVILDGNIIKDVQTDSVSIRGHQSPKARNKFWFENNVVQKVWRHGFSISSFDIVHIAQNWFNDIRSNAFERIRSSESRRLNCTFVNNEIENYETSAMTFSSPLTVENIKLPDPCSCNLIGHVGQWLVGVSSSTKEKTTINSSKNDKIWSKEELGIIEDALLCRESGEHKYQYIKEYYEQKCLRTPREKPKTQTLCNFHNFCNCYQKLGSNISRTVVDCSCYGKSMTISPLSGLEKIPDDAAELRIKGCSTIFIRDQSMAQLNRLEELEFSKIEKIVIEKNGLSITTPHPSLKIEFKEVKLHGGSFRGRYNSLTFSNVQFVSSITPKFFSDLILNKMTFYQSNITDIPKGTFQNVQISNMTVNECNIGAIREGGITVTSNESVTFFNNRITIMDRNGTEIKWSEDGTSGGLFFANNSIETIHKEALVTTASRPVVFRNNIFESSYDYAFHGLEQNTQQCVQQCNSYKPDVIFENNEFRNYDKRVIIVPPYFRVRKLKLHNECTCNLIEEVKHLLAASSIAKATDSSSGNLSMSRDPDPTSLRTVLMCQESNGKYISIEDYEDVNCGMKDSENLVFKIAIPVAAITFLIILIVMAICLFHRTKALREREKKTEQLQEQITSLNMLGPVLWDKRKRGEQTTTLQPDILADAKKSDRADSWVMNTPAKEILLHPKFLAQAQVNEIDEPHIYEIPTM